MPVVVVLLSNLSKTCTGAVAEMFVLMEPKNIT